VIWDRKVGIISRLLAVNQGIMFWFPVYVRDYYISRSVIPSLRLTRTLHQYKLQFKYSRLNSPRREADNLVPKFRRSGALSYFPPPHRPLSRAQQELQFSLSLRTIDHSRKQGNTVALVHVVRSWNPTRVVLESQRLGYLALLPV